VQVGHTYSVFLSIDGMMSIEEDYAVSISGLMDQMVEQMKHQEDPTAVPVDQ
jgi:hypothetical protein